MKKLLFLAACIALTMPAPAHAQNAKYPTNKTYAAPKKKFSNKGSASNTATGSYVPPMNFNFSKTDEEEGPKVVNQYDAKYRITGGEETDIKNVLPDFNYKLDFVRAEGAAPGNATLRMMTPLALSGCVHLQQPVVTIRENAPIIALHITSSELVLDKTVRYAHFQCDVRSQYAYFDLPLNREDLLEKGIHTITINTDSGQFRKITLDVNDDRVIAMASAGGIATYWFYPENTVVLTASENLSDDARSELNTRARSAGLIPMAEEMATYDAGSALANNAYFIDNTGHLKKQIAEAGKPVAFGTVSTTETYFGPNGQYKQPRNIQVFAKLPGAHE